MTMPGMLDMSTNPLRPRRSLRARFIAKMFAVGIGAAVLDGTVAIMQNAPEADAVSQAEINRFIRVAGGIPPCKEEDGSGQPSPCYWNAQVQGNGDGWSFIAMPDGKDKDDDKDIVYLNGPLAERY